MRRRDVVAGTLLGAAGVSALAGTGPVEGRDFERLASLVAVPGGAIDVVEFFWYGCPHCFAFEPLLEPWAARLPADTRFRRVPYGFDETLRELHQQIYITWEVLGLVGRMHARTFERFHRQHRSINTLADMLAFARESELNAESVRQAWQGAEVRQRLAAARSFCDDFGVDFVPQLGLQGRYLTSPSAAGDGRKALAVADDLLERLRKGA